MKIGIIVGRFQVPELHVGHKYLVETVQNENDKVIVFIGQSPVQTDRNPLPVEYVRQHFNVQTEIIPDVKYNDIWVYILDSMIKRITSPEDTITLYGGRDSFLNVYNGKFKTKEIECPHPISATQIRKNIKEEEITLESAKGIIQSYNYRFPTAFPTVDILITDGKRLLLGRKVGESGYRLVGGFADPTDDSFEDAGKRELYEETGITASELQYMGSFKINDWRYRGTKDGIITSLFLTKVEENVAFSASDDIAELKWFDINNLPEIIDAHIPLIDCFKSSLYAILK